MGDGGITSDSNKKASVQAIPDLKFDDTDDAENMPLSSKFARVALTPVLIPPAAFAWCFGASFLVVQRTIESTGNMIGLKSAGRYAGTPFFIPGMLLVSPL